MEPVSGKKSRELIQLGLHESLVNAVVHGNSCKPNKSIRVRRIITPNWFVWQICDDGIGIPAKNIQTKSTDTTFKPYGIIDNDDIPAC